MTDYPRLLRALASHRVEFIVVGGAAATAHGAARLGEIVGGNYESLLPDTEAISVAGIECLCLNLERLIQVKRAAGRPKDLEAIAELEALRDERQANGLQ